MSLRTVAKKALPWVALALAVAALGYTWNWALTRATERHRAHNAFTTGTSKYIFGLCPATSIKDDVPRWVTDMRGICQVRQPTWGNAEQGLAGPNLNIESGSKWEAVHLLSKLALEITPGKVLSLLTLVVISLAGLLGMQKSALNQGISPRLRVTRGAALTMLVLVLLALTASLVLLNAQETTTMCQMTGNTYANLLSIDARCSQQTMLMRETQAALEQKKGELDARAKELEDLKQEIASLGAMRDALGTFKTELKSQSESTQQLIMAVTGATLESISKTVDPLHRDVKGLDQALKSDFKNDLRTDLQGDVKALMQEELKAALQSEAFRDVVRREVRAAVQEDVRAVVRGEVQDSIKTVVAASHVPAPAAVPAEPKEPAPAEPVPAVVAKAAAPAPVQVKAPAPTPVKAVSPPAHKPANPGTQRKLPAPVKHAAPAPKVAAGAGTSGKTMGPVGKTSAAPAPIKR